MAPTSERPSRALVASAPKALVARRIDLPSVVAGFDPPPPARASLKFFPLGERWTLVAMTDPGMPTKLARWIARFEPREIHIAPGLSPRVLRASFDRLPEPWLKVLSTIIVHYIQLTPEGAASIFVEDSRPKIGRFVAALQGDPRMVRERKTQSNPGRVRLTARQLEVVSLAVALGYYETPHRVDLRSLGRKLGLSVGAASELLRRGEALIITSYIDSLSASNWRSDSPSPSQADLIDQGRPSLP